MNMMRTGLIACVLFLCTAHGHTQGRTEPGEQDRSWNIASFTPELTRNDAPQLCAPYAEAWTDLFNGTGSMNSDDLDVTRIPHDAVFSFPPTRPQGADTLYGKYFSVRHDLDGDGDTEVLLIVSNDLGWRYLGSNLFIFETEAEFEAVISQFEAKATSYPKIDRYLPVWQLAELAEEAMPDSAIRFGPLRQVHLVLYQGALYTVSDEAWYMRYQPDVTHETLRRVWPMTDAEPVCEMHVRPRPEAFEPFTSGSPFFRALRAMYAGPEQGGACYGTMGWTGIPPERLLPDIFFRPQATPEPRGSFRPQDDHASDVARQLRTLSWGTNSPGGWEVYLSLRQDEPEFVRRITVYYQDRYGMTPDAAGASALQAWRALVDRVFYARNNDMPLAFLATSAESPVSFARFAPLDGILDEVVANIHMADDLPLRRASMWSSAIAAATYSDRALEEIRALYKGALDAGQDRTTERSSKKTEHERARLHNQIVSAATTRPEVLDMLLKLGVPAAGPTNGFDKTTLMYAAQQDQLASARLLLAAGAEVNARTGENKQRCFQLERDNRSALMYAAENASEELIDLLLDAGADSEAQDTQGNGVAWYLDRNAGLGNESRARLSMRLKTKARSPQ
tara:strand:- start:410 stop:2275 length:1866 start_codon:yes stop_codon:yes gene_type:complete